MFRSLALVCLAALSAAPSGVAAQLKVDPNPIFKGLSWRESKLARKAVQVALETVASGESHHWRDGIGISSGHVTLLRTFRIATGHYCREYRLVLSTNAGAVSVNRTACRNTTGIWREVVGP
jgi:surface antigen